MASSLSMRITFKNLITFTLPTIIMMIFTSMYTIVDGIFVSRLINTDALSAVNIVWPFIGAAIGVGTMFGTGMSAIVSIKNGSGRNREANTNFTFLFIVLAALSSVFAILSFLFIDKIVIFLGANEAIYDYCYDYGIVSSFFIPFCMLQMYVQSSILADGKPMMVLAVSLTGGVTNIILDYVFIKICGMGVSGAAAATGIGYTLQTLFGIVYFSANKKGLIHFVRPQSDIKMLLSAMANGSSEMVSNLSSSITTLLFNLTMMHFLGQDGVAAITVVLYIDFFLVAVALGYSMGIAPVISYNYGAEDKAKLRKLFNISVNFIGIFSVTVTALTIIFRGPLVGSFAKQDTPVYEMAKWGMLLFASGYLFKGYNIFASSLFTAYSNGKISAVLSFVRTFGLTVLFIIAFAWILGVNGIWIAVPAAECLTLILAVYYIFKYRHRYYYMK